MLVLLLALCLTAGTLFGCSSDSEGKDEPATVTIAQSSDPQTLDPHKVGGDISANIFRNVCETLLTYDEKLGDFRLCWQSPMNRYLTQSGSSI